ncbi:TPA: MoxR family ATPase, partial [Candidatus Woesearchaeota archaeon]|nr:MoxR family ATPase [Candidatus Woesearchaeota archaeon]
QNPIEQEGTYPLPEAQADRFLLKIQVNYPTFEEEVEIVNRYTGELKEPKMRTLLNKSALLGLQALVRQVPIANDIRDRAVKIVHATRNTKDLVHYGASPRASLSLVLTAKARALIKGRTHVSSEDLNAMAPPVLRHRIILNFEAERKGITTDEAISQIVSKVR